MLIHSFQFQTWLNLILSNQLTVGPQNGQGPPTDNTQVGGRIHFSDTGDGNVDDEDNGYYPGYSTTIQQEYVYSSDPPGAPPPRVVSAGQAGYTGYQTLGLSQSVPVQNLRPSVSRTLI